MTVADRALFERVAPRLARAHAAERQRLAEREHNRLLLMDAVVRLESLVAHRDLQLIRSGRRPLSYQHQRQAKLREAEAALERMRRRLRQL